jgi:hypothetical protein
VKKPVSKFGFQMQPAALHIGSATFRTGGDLNDFFHGGALHVESS